MTTRRASAFSAILAIAMAGCATPPSPDDAAVGDAWTPPGVPGTISVLDPTTEGPPLPIEGLWLRIASIRLVGDRGPELDPRVEGVGWVSIGAAGLDVPIGDVPPALYSAVDLLLAADAADAGAPVFELRLVLDRGPTLVIRTTEPIELLARCEHGAVVNTTDAVHVGIDLALGEAVAALLLRPLPAPDADDVITVDETTAPATIAAFREELREHVHSECGPDEI